MTVVTVAGERRQHEAFYWNGVKKEQCEEEHTVTGLYGRRAEVESERRSLQVDWRAQGESVTLRWWRVRRRMRHHPPPPPPPCIN